MHVLCVCGTYNLCMNGHVCMCAFGCECVCVCISVCVCVCVCVCMCRTLRRVRTRKSLNPSDLLRLVKQPARETRSAVRAADYLEYTLQLLQDRHHIHKRSLNATGTLAHTHRNKMHTHKLKHAHTQTQACTHTRAMCLSPPPGIRAH